MKLYAALLVSLMSSDVIATIDSNDSLNTDSKKPYTQPVFSSMPNAIPAQIHSQYPKITASLAMGLLAGGEAQEFSYKGDATVSQLNWEIKVTPTAQATLGLALSPFTIIKAQAWSTLNPKTSMMNDYDWLDQNNRNRLTHWSNHPDSRLNYANEFDLNLNQTLFLTPSYQIGALAGYQENRMSWTAKGGSFQYSQAASTSVQHGHFAANTLLIGYQQKFSTPYIGVSAQYSFRKLEVNGAVKYSPWVKATDTDHHYLRDLEFKTELKDTHYYGVNLNSGYYVTPRVKLFSELSWSEFKRAKGTLHYTSNTDKKTSSLKNAGGLSNQHFNFNVGAQIRF